MKVKRKINLQLLVPPTLCDGWRTPYAILKLITLIVNGANRQQTCHV